MEDDDQPHSSGRHRYGVAKVLSTTNGMPCSRASAEWLEVENVAARVANGLAVECARLGPDRLGGLDAVRVDEAHAEAELLEGVFELGERPAVEGPRGDDMIARV